MFVRSEVVTVVNTKINVLWLVPPCGQSDRSLPR